LGFFDAKKNEKEQQYDTLRGGKHRIKGAPPWFADPNYLDLVAGGPITDEWGIMMSIPVIWRDIIRIKALHHHQLGLRFEQLKRLHPGIDLTDGGNGNLVDIHTLHDELFAERYNIHELVQVWKRPFSMRASNANQPAVVVLDDDSSDVSEDSSDVDEEDEPLSPQ
jgi:hypothetical protein